MHHADRNAHVDLAASRRTHNPHAIRLAAQREAAHARRKPSPLVAFFILASVVYAVACIFLPATL